MNIFVQPIIIAAIVVAFDIFMVFNSPIYDANIVDDIINFVGMF